MCAVVVTYHPDGQRLAEVLRSLRNQVDDVVVVDNGSPALGEETLRSLFAGLRVHHLHANKGLAYAQNRGIALARAAGASHVLLLDQDSVPLPGMAQALLNALHGLQRNGMPVACVGPRLKLAPSDHASRFRRLGWLGPRSAGGAAPGASAECDFLISSGSLVPVAVLDEVGAMEEALFIDQVDTEWCCRARSLGYRVFGVWDAVLDHRVGESVHWIWLGRWRRLFAQKPVRYYYIFRNTLLILRRRYVEAKFVPFHLAWLAAMLLVFGIFDRRPEVLGMMLKGIAHAALGLSGELPAPSAALTQAPRSVAPNRQDSGRG